MHKLNYIYIFSVRRRRSDMIWSGYDVPAIETWANRRNNVGLRLVAEVVGDRKGQISRNKVDGHVQNWSCHLTTGGTTNRREHITPVLFALHWLPIRQRIQFKLLLLVYRCTHQLAPVYLTDLVVPYVPTRSLRSADQNLLTVKRYNLERYGRRSFSVAGPSSWNALQSDIRNYVSLPAFRSSLKSHLFREAFVTLM